ncbi:hypothetical protein WJX81_002221 [Elliptochloris bilobata]|uniref:ENT domain-containing protein n=1 Tax=Elliptochloris bilobata TaxID=381761 RepID=A0AAW1S0T4_9CHLO
MDNYVPSLVSLQTEAYRAVLRAIAATELDWSKEKLLTDLRKELQISNDEHYKVLSGVMADEEVTAIRTGVTMPAPPQAAMPQGPGGAVPGPKRRKDGEERMPLGARLDRKQLKKARLAEKELAPPPLPVAAPLAGPRAPVRPGPAQRMAQMAPAPESPRLDPRRGPGRPPGRPALAQATAADAAKRGRMGRMPVGQAGAPLAALRPGEVQINELVGRKIWRFWPDEERQWVEGIVTDYRAADDHHAITYDMNTPKESFEWFAIRNAREGVDYKLSDGLPLDPRELVHAQAAKMAAGDAPAQRFPSPAAPRRAGPKVPARGRPPSGKTLPLAGAAVSGALASHWAPFDARWFARTLPAARREDLAAMAARLDTRAAEVRSELAGLAELEAGMADPVRRLRLQLDDLAAAERRVRGMLADPALADSEDELF